jgi:hypothetical protein
MKLGVMAVTMNMAVFWVIVLYSLVVVCQRFRGCLFLHHQAGWVSHVQKRRANILTHFDHGSETWTRTVGEANALRIFERKIYGPIQEKMLKNKDKQKDKGPITGGRYCKIYQILRSLLVWGTSGHVRKILPSVRFEPYIVKPVMSCYST